MKWSARIARDMIWNVSCRHVVLRVAGILRPLRDHQDVIPVPVPIVAVAIENI